MNKNLRAYLYTAIATIMSRILNLSTSSTTSSFTDVNTNAWYSDSIQACYEAGLIKLDTSK